MGWFQKKTVYLKCPVPLPNGKKCGRRFASVQGLADHVERAHGGTPVREL